MSRAFVKDDGPEEQPLVPPRAPLPSGVANYVTPRGLALLKAELAELEADRGRLQSDSGAAGAHAQEIVVLAGRITELTGRIAGARVVDPRRQPQEEVRFGATVTLRASTEGTDGEERTVTIVGVDEAAAAEGRVAFTAPVARAITGKRVRDTVTLQTPGGEEVLEIRAIAYDLA